MQKAFTLTNLSVFLMLAFMWFETEAVQRFCGKTLTDTMAVLCKSGFNKKLLKRNDFLLDRTHKLDYNSLADDIINLNMSEAVQNPLSAFPYPTLNYTVSSNALNRILSKLYPSMMLTHTHQRRLQRRGSSLSGIYYECCLKDCSTAELIAYCL